MLQNTNIALHEKSVQVSIIRSPTCIYSAHILAPYDTYAKYIITNS